MKSPSTVEFLIIPAHSLLF